MTVCYIESRDFLEFFGNLADGGFIVDNPESVSESVGSHEIIFGFAGCHVTDDGLEFLVVGECEEHRFDVGIVYAHMLHAVLFLVSAGKLMLFDSTLHIVFHPCRHYETVLCTTVHGLRIDVVVLLVILLEPALLLEFVEVFHSLVVNLRVMFVKSGFEIDFRLDDMIEALFVSFGLFACFLTVEDVVGTGCHFLDKLAGRAYSFEWFYFCHDNGPEFKVLSVFCIVYVF